MKICHIIPILTAGGAQTFLLDLIKEQSKKNQITLVIINKIDLSNDYNLKLYNKYLDLGIEIQCLGRKRKSLNVIKAYTKGFIFLLKNKYDFINTHLPFAHFFTSLLLFTSQKKRKSHIMTIHNAPERINILSKILNKKTPKIYCSKSSYELNKYPECKNAIVNNGITLEQSSSLALSKSEVFKMYEIPENSKIILLIGALRNQKNYPFLVDLVKSYFSKEKSIHFLVCGGYEEGEDYINTNKISNLHFIGKTEYINELLSYSEIYLSVSKFEGLPISLLEALRSNIKIVASPIIQHKDVIQDIPYCYIPERFVLDQFHNKIMESLNTTPTKETIQNSRKALIEEYDIRNCSKKYLEFYESLV
ncbi:glycosyltransferase [Flammeovirga sp. EKP202]|uniref:glycosyltransferase n=1 Tax=Flammeovirga sp. EKP202 TaxID=2770592 RepID=UPI00165F1363|nr:glycosyltransferase [Flammeovirga sp. EKP202]MBD0404485.1 glycosyltransferase [Flammeovirga sp. EKP202]